MLNAVYLNGKIGCKNGLKLTKGSQNRKDFVWKSLGTNFEEAQVSNILPGGPSKLACICTKKALWFGILSDPRGSVSLSWLVSHRKVVAAFAAKGGIRHMEKNIPNTLDHVWTPIVQSRCHNIDEFGNICHLRSPYHELITNKAGVQGFDSWASCGLSLQGYVVHLLGQSVSIDPWIEVFACCLLHTSLSNFH